MQPGLFMSLFATVRIDPVTKEVPVYQDEDGAKEIIVDPASISGVVLDVGENEVRAIAIFEGRPILETLKCKP